MFYTEQLANIKYKFAVLITINKDASRDCVCKKFIAICTYVLIQEIEKWKTVKYLYLVTSIYHTHSIIK